MKSFLAALTVCIVLSAALSGMALADLNQSEQAKAQDIVAADAVAILNAPAVAVTVFSLVKNPYIFDKLPEDERERCEDQEGSAAEIDLACKLVFQRIIEEVKAFLAASYGMTQSIGQFDPTTIAYTRDLTLAFLDLD